MTERKAKVKIRQVTGRILFIQEERFRMVDDNGRAYLFDLAYNTSIKNETLFDWSAAGTRVTATYDGEPEFESGIVRTLKAA